MRFALAPMSTMLKVVTVVLFFFPLALLGAALGAEWPPVRQVLFGTFAFMAVMYASVWLLFRPSAFVVTGEGLRIEWPLRSRLIPRADLGEALTMDGPGFRREYGLGMRVGAGGLFGGFGLLVCSKVTFSMWISRTDDYVIVHLHNARPLLITPEHPARFIAALKST